MMDFLSAHAPSCRRSLSVGQLATSQFGHFAEEGFAYAVDTLVGRPLDDYTSCYPMKKCRSHTSIAQAAALEEAALHAAEECGCYTVSSAPENAICVFDTDGEPNSPPDTVPPPSALLLSMHAAHSTTSSTLRSSRSGTSLLLSRTSALASSTCGIPPTTLTAMPPTAQTDASAPPSSQYRALPAAVPAAPRAANGTHVNAAGFGSLLAPAGCVHTPPPPPQHQHHEQQQQRQKRQSSSGDLMGAFSVLTAEQWEVLRSAVAEDDSPGGHTKQGHAVHMKGNGGRFCRDDNGDVPDLGGDGADVGVASFPSGQQRHPGGYQKVGAAGASCNARAVSGGSGFAAAPALMEQSSTRSQVSSAGGVERLSPAGDSGSSIASLWAAVNNSMAANNSGVYDSTDDNVLAGQRWLSAEPLARRVAPPHHTPPSTLPNPIANSTPAMPAGAPGDTAPAAATSGHLARVPVGGCPAGSHYEHLRSPIRHQSSDPALSELPHYHPHTSRIYQATHPPPGINMYTVNSNGSGGGGGNSTHLSYVQHAHPHQPQVAVPVPAAADDDVPDSPSADLSSLAPRSASCTHATGTTGGFPAARSPLLAGYYSHLPEERSSDSLSNLAETRTRAATRSSLDLYFYSARQQPAPPPAAHAAQQLQQPHQVQVPPQPPQQQQVLPRIRVGAPNGNGNHHTAAAAVANGSHVSYGEGSGALPGSRQLEAAASGGTHQHPPQPLQQQHPAPQQQLQQQHNGGRGSAGSLGSGSGGSSSGSMPHRAHLQTHRYYSPARGRRGSLATGSTGNPSSAAPSSMSAGTPHVAHVASVGGGAGGGGSGGGGNSYLYRRAQSSFEAVSAALQLGRGSSGFVGLGCGGRASDNDADDDDDEDTEETTRRITAAFRHGAGTGGRSSGWGLLGADTAPVTPSGESGTRGREAWAAAVTTTMATGEGGGEEGEGAGQDGANGEEGSGSGSLTRKRSSYHLTNSHAAVELFLRLNHARQTMDFAKRQTMLFAALDKAVLTVWEALALLDELREYEAVLLAEAGEAQEIANLSLLDHAFQCAELCRLHHPDTDWMHLMGLIHGLGKLLSHRRFGSQPQWAICGETYPLGCRFSPHILGSQYFTANPDRRRRLYNTPTGPYGPGCGLLNVVMSWSAPEYLHLVLLLNGTKLPQDALWLLRHVKFLSLTRPQSTYLPLCCPNDLRLLPLLRSFQSLTAYRRQELPPGFALEGGERTAYYTGLIEKYIGAGSLRW